MILYIIYYIHLSIRYILYSTFIRRHSPRFPSISSSLVSSVGKNLPGVPSQESNSDLPYSNPTYWQLSYAAPYLSYDTPLTELRRTLTELRRTLTEQRRSLTELRRIPTELRRTLTDLRRILWNIATPLATTRPGAIFIRRKFKPRNIWHILK